MVNLSRVESAAKSQGWSGCWQDFCIMKQNVQVKKGDYGLNDDALPKGNSIHCLRIPQAIC
jgi:hypothetical protein